MIIETLVVGPIMANCYIVGCEKTKQAIVIDPGDEAEHIVDTLNNLNLKLQYIINTHGHFDHVGGNKELKDATGAPIMIHELDAPMLKQLSNHAAAFGLSAEDSPPADKFLKEGDVISFGEISLKVIHTPGHSLGGISLLTDKVVFVGDSLFAGSIGRTDLQGGDYETLISSIKNKILVLGDDVKVYPGHGPETTVKQEKRFNPFMR